MATYYINYDSPTNGAGTFADPKNRIPTVTTGEAIAYPVGGVWSDTGA